jgi:hypothetical protein
MDMGWWFIGVVVIFAAAVAKLRWWSIAHGFSAAGDRDGS